MFIVHTTLLSLNDDERSHPVANGTPTPSRLSGTTVVSLTHVRNPPPGKFFFILNDLSIRQEGYYKLKFRVFEVPLSHPFVYLRGEVESDVVTVYSPKKFPGLGKSSSLIKELALKGMKVRVRKESTLQNQRKKKSSAVITAAITQSLTKTTETKHIEPNYNQQSQSQLYSSLEKTEEPEECNSITTTAMIPIHSINEYSYMQNSETIATTSGSMNIHNNTYNLPITIETKSKSSSPEIKLEYSQSTLPQQLQVPTDPSTLIQKVGTHFMTTDALAQQQEYHPPLHQHHILADPRFMYSGLQQSGSQQLQQQPQIVQSQPSLALIPNYKTYNNLQFQHQVEQQQLQQQPQQPQFFNNPAEISAPYISQQFIEGPPQHGFISASSPGSSTNVTPISNIYSIEQQPPF